MAHTKGEWVIDRAIDERTGTVIRGGDIQTGCVKPKTICHMVKWATREDDARLIAAAPKLLEACREWQALDESVMECATCLRGHGCPNHASQLKLIREMRDAAIKAALGEEG
jgi:hypothetical protein